MYVSYVRTYVCIYVCMHACMYVYILPILFNDLEFKVNEGLIKRHLVHAAIYGVDQAEVLLV